jgi:hypothetical protein
LIFSGVGRLLPSEFSEVAMGRPAEVFVRPVTMTGDRCLQRIGRTAKDPVKLRRAIVVPMSAQGQSVPDTARLLNCSQEYVRGVIHAFNDSGFQALDPKWSGGGPRRSLSRWGGRSACSPGAVLATWGWRSAPGV